MAIESSNSMGGTIIYKLVQLCTIKISTLMCSQNKTGQGLGHIYPTNFIVNLLFTSHEKSWDYSINIKVLASFMTSLVTGLTI